MSDVYKELELPSILEHLCDFQVTSEMLRNPVPAFMKAVLQAFLRECHFNVEAMDVLPWTNGNHIIEYKELYEDMSMAVFFTIVRKYMDAARIPDFSIRDLLDPKPKRTRKILSVLVIFWKYVVTRLKNYEDVEAELQNEILEERALLEENAELEKQYAEHLEMKVNPTKKQELEEMLRQSKLNELVAAKKTINKEYQILKTNIANEEKKYNELDIFIITEKEKIEELNNKILKSPNRFTSDIEGLKKKVKEFNEMILDLSGKKKELKKQEIASFITCMDNFTKFSEICNVLIDVSETLGKEALIIDEKQHLIEELSEKMETQNRELNRIIENISLSEQKWSQTELQSKMQIEGQKKILEVNQCSEKKELDYIKALETSIVDADQELSLSAKKGDSIDNEIKEVVTNIREQHTSKIQEYENYVQLLITEIKLAMETIKEVDL